MHYIFSPITATATKALARHMTATEQSTWKLSSFKLSFDPSITSIHYIHI